MNCRFLEIFGKKGVMYGLSSFKNRRDTANTNNRLQFYFKQHAYNFAVVA